jgi:hypothetical protein
MLEEWTWVLAVLYSYRTMYGRVYKVEGVLCARLFPKIGAVVPD